MNHKHTFVETEELLDDIDVTDKRELVVFNDDINTFHHVIQTLIKVCKHTPEQAEQCTWIVHYKGKCSVKAGSLSKLNPMKQAICEAGIDARVL